MIQNRNFHREKKYVFDLYSNLDFFFSTIGIL